MGKQQEKQENISLDDKTQEMIKNLVTGTQNQIKQIQNHLQERLGLIVATYVNAKGKDDRYTVSEDFTELILSP